MILQSTEVQTLTSWLYWTPRQSLSKMFKTSPWNQKKTLFGRFQDIDSMSCVSEKSNICQRYLHFHVLLNVKITLDAIFGVDFCFKSKVIKQVFNAYLNFTQIDFYSDHLNRQDIRKKGVLGVPLFSSNSKEFFIQMLVQWSIVYCLCISTSVIAFKLTDSD